MMSLPTRIRGRFVRSVRLDAAHEATLDGYLPTARALDVVRRVVRGMGDSNGTRAFSITGPYGSGKSSLAVFLDALCGPTDDPAHTQACALLAEHDPETFGRLPDARTAMGLDELGMSRAVITAPQREPVTTTVVRALHSAATGADVPPNLRAQLSDALSRCLDDKYASPSFHEIRDFIVKMSDRRPVLLVIDEFGKNLEAYSEAGSEADLYLLQELAEWASSADERLPLIVVTIQHLSFESYAASDSAAKRREWGKVQGRFEDIPFVDSAAATRNLIAAALDHGEDNRFDSARASAASGVAHQADQVGLPEVASTTDLAATWPLHPATLLVLPELCARYGQNERTLFSFLASPEPQSVTSWLEGQDGDSNLNWVRLDRVYDYFVDSASNFLALNDDGARWTEISTAIRDTHGLTDAQLRVLKTVGVLNLVASTGTMRASLPLVTFASVDGQPGTSDDAEVHARLDQLAGFGLLTFRDYAQEYRIWRGSDFDINAALRVARRAASHSSAAELLATVRPMQPVVPARHATQTGTIRAFECTYADDQRSTVTQPEPRSVCDGLLVYHLDDREVLIGDDNGSPVVVIDAADLGPVRQAAIEVAALVEVATEPTLRADDHTARRELSERSAHAQLKLDEVINLTFGADATWTWINPPDGQPQVLDAQGTVGLSRVLDAAYSGGPDRIAYEAINRAELTSAGASARRRVLGALADPKAHQQSRLGLEGAGPDVAMYRAVLEDSGVHASIRLGPPDEGSGWRRVWDAVDATLQGERAAFTGEHLLRVMMSAPYGLREGTASLLLAAYLITASKRLAVYEHGTFQPRLSAAVLERFVRNPRNFAVKYLGTRRSGRPWQAVRELNREFDRRELGDSSEELTVLGTVQRIAAVMREANSTYMVKTTRFHGLGLDDAEVRDATQARDAILQAREPDVLLFEGLPAALGLQPVHTKGVEAATVTEYAQRTAAALHAIADANRALDTLIFETVSTVAVAQPAGRAQLDSTARMRAMEVEAEGLVGVDTISPDLRAFVQACLMHPSAPDELGRQIATTVTGASPRDWLDHAVTRNLGRLRDTARAFRRVGDLVRARTSYEHGDRSFEAFAVTLTAADGRTLDATVTLSSETRLAATEAVDGALRRLEGFGSDAVNMLLAAVSERALPGMEDSANPHTDGATQEVSPHG